MKKKSPLKKLTPSSQALFNALNVGGPPQPQPQPQLQPPAVQYVQQPMVQHMMFPAFASAANSQGSTTKAANTGGGATQPCNLARLLSKDHQVRPANFTPVIPSKSAQQRRGNKATMMQIQELERMAGELERTAREAKLEAKRRKQQTKHTVTVWVNGVPRRIKCQTADMIFDDISSITGSVRST